MTAFDARIPHLCQDACIQIFALYRKIINLRAVLNDPMSWCGIGTLASEVQSITNLLEMFDSTVGLWLQRSIDNFIQLSSESQLSAGQVPQFLRRSVARYANESTGFVVMFWNLGVLCFVETIQSTCGDLANLCPNVFATLRYYQQKITSSFGEVSRLIMSSSAESDIWILDNTELKKPFMAHHANTQLVVMALQKAIEHTIDLHCDAVEISDENLDLMQSLKPVVWCLWTLERTSAGRCTARLALMKLMKQYGDILMECWAPDEL